MTRISKIRFAGWALLVVMLLYVGGCASFQARQAYEAAEELTAEEQFDAAFQKYFEASELEPGSKKYKLELLAARTRAAAQHVRQARLLARQGHLAEALDKYRLAQGLDPSIEIANQEAKVLRNLVDARKLAEEGADFYEQRKLALARKAIDRALQLDPVNARALAIRDLLNRDQRRIEMDGIALDVASADPITLSFKDANIKEVFAILTQLSGINFIFDEDIRSQSVSVLLEKASFAQALQLIMQMNGLAKKVLNSKTVIIYPLSRDKEKQYEDQLIQTFYLSHIDAKKAVNLLRTMLQLRKIYVHEERNALVIRDKPEVIRLAEQILLAADRENSEVIFDLELVSVSNSDELKLGPRLSTYSISAGVSQDGTNIVSGALGSTTDGLVNSLSDLEGFYTLPSATFDFAKTLADSEVLASPKIRVRNKEKAKVHIGTREPVITVTNNGDNFSDSIQYVDVGVKLDVEPNIQLDKTVETKLKLEVSQKLSEGETERGTKFLTIATTNAETVLTLQDGVQTIIGGLYEQQDISARRTFPILGDIPLLGSLLSNFEKRDLKREILLSITPHIIKQIELPASDIATIWSGGEDNLKAGPNFGAFAQTLVSEVEEAKPLTAPAVKPLQLQSPEAAQAIVIVTPEFVAAAPPESSDGESAVPEEPSEGENTASEVPLSGQEAGVEQTPLLPAEGAPAEGLPVTTGLADTVPEIDVVADVLPDEVSSGEDVVPTEILSRQEEIGPPIVLEMPKKAPATIGFSGPLQAAQGEAFAVAVVVKDIEQLYSAPLFVSYDPAVLELLSVSEGDFLKQEGQTTVFSSSPNRVTGQVIVGYKQGSGGQGVSGSGTLFNMNFRPIAPGKTPLEINRLNLRNPEGVRLEVVAEAVTIEVR